MMDPLDRSHENLLLRTVMAGTNLAKRWYRHGTIKSCSVPRTAIKANQLLTPGPARPGPVVVKFRGETLQHYKDIIVHNYPSVCSLRRVAVVGEARAVLCRASWSFKIALQ